MNAISPRGMYILKELDRSFVSGGGRYEPRLAPIAAQFRELLDVWRRETLLLSSIEDMSSHPAFKEIVSMGYRAVPLILAELIASPDMLILTLSHITNEDPVQEANLGNLAAMTNDWRRWWQKEGDDQGD